MESDDQAMMVETITNLIESCTNLTGVNKLATFDIEYLFLQIRSKSVGETVDVNMTCPDDNETQVQVTIPLEEVTVKISDKHTILLLIVLIKYLKVKRYMKQRNHPKLN